MDYQPSYGFLKDCLYRSESYKVTLADAYVCCLSGAGAGGVSFLPMPQRTAERIRSGMKHD